MIGIWTEKFGWVSSTPLCPGYDHVPIDRYHNKWEFWVYYVVFGLAQTPYYSFSQTVMAELSPPGFDFMVCAAQSWHMPSLMCGDAVLWSIRNDKSLIVDPRTECNAGDHRQDGQHLARFFIPLF
jgi:hypothetical protein